MLNQYHPQRYTVRNGRKVGTVPAGTIIYIQDRGSWNRYTGPVCRNPWMVEAWLNRDCMGTILAGGHLAQVRSLRNGQVLAVADHILLTAVDAGLEKQ